MSYESLEHDLLVAFQSRFGFGEKAPVAAPSTRVLEDAEFVSDQSIDVFIDMAGTKAAAAHIWQLMKDKNHSTQSWSMHEIHPKATDGEETVNFIFTMDLLNFSFWNDDPNGKFTVEYAGKQWTGYWSLVAALRRALDDNIPITSSDFWQSEEECTEEVLRHVFRSTTPVELPLISERLSCLREAGQILYEKYSCTPAKLIEQADHSAAKLINILADVFPCFRDQCQFEGEQVRFLKRAQIFVADLWACFNGQEFGRFDDIDTVTAFADYRIPQMLQSLGVFSYSPPLESALKRLQVLKHGSDWEVQIRGSTIWACELILREIKHLRSRVEASDDSAVHLNAILLDFLLWDTVKAKTSECSTPAIVDDLVEEVTDSNDLTYSRNLPEMLPHHRTRCIWY